jgi:phthiocerol/phenolphthiocerol synthesis type-I polyketide synthase B
MSGARRARTERAVAITGIGCRFPGGITDPAGFWRLLCEGGSVVSAIPPDRMEVGRWFDPQPAVPGRMMTRWGGFLDGIDAIDAGFFGLSPREAERLDPQQRLLLECAWEALEDAGEDITRLAGSHTGVFVGQWLSDFEARLFADPEAVDFYMTLGSGRYASAGRISYLLGLRGPSLTLDTACSSSLAAVHLAVQSIRSGESDLALAGGASIILQPHISIAYSQSRMMAADGRCKFGDAGADGYVRSEGVALIVLKPLARARADGDRIHAVIRGSAVNNDGRSSGSMGTPSRIGQEELLRAAYADAGISPGRVGYVEAHGTGTLAGDPVELGALAAVLGEGRAPGSRALVGSVKTNLGHTEGTAGVAGLIKAALALEHGLIPASLNCTTLNPAIPWDAMPCAIARTPVAWPEDAARIAGVSAFGIAGTNAHVVLAAAEVVAAPAPAVPAGPMLLPLSARSPQALRALAGRYADLLATDDAPALADVCWSAATRRTALEYRAAFVATDRAGMVEALRQYAGEDRAVPAVDPAARPKIAFVMPGQGAQWRGMARELMACEPKFRDALARCDAAARAHVDWSILDQLAAEPGSTADLFDRIDVIQPVLVALAIAYAELFRARGIIPDAVVGHSMGEVAAACVAGALDLDQAMGIICRRAALMRGVSGRGAMALVDIGFEAARERIRGCADRVAVAVSNSPRSSVISGDPAAVAEVMAGLDRENIFCRLVKVDVASHSPQMAPLAAELAAALADLAPAPTNSPMWSTVRARRVDGSELDATYWAANLREPVRFADTVAALIADGVSAFVELGPHPVLLPAIEQSAQAAGEKVAAIACGRREEPEAATMLAAVGALWAAGHPVDWRRILPASRCVPLPFYPWQRERLWVEQAEIAAPQARAARPKLDAELRGFLHRLQWEPCDPPAIASVPEAPVARWLVLAADAAGSAFATALADAGASAATAPLAELEAAISAWAGGARKPGGILLLADDTGDTPFLPLRLLQAVLAARWTVPPRLWLATSGAQAVTTDARVSVDQAALWGAARVIAEEHPEFWGGLADLDPADPVADAADLARHLLASRGHGDRDGEDQVAWRRRRRHALRLVADSGEGSAVTLRADAAYLITGGLGDIGLHIARELAERGARRLVLLGRTPLPERAHWSTVAADTTAGARIAAIRALEAQGVAVQVAAVDVGDEAALAAFLDRYRAEAWPPIRGVVHAAATLSNQLAAAMDRTAFDAVLAPKLRAAQHLDRLLPDLDLFILFSSMSGFLAHPGIANYAAANAGLDAIAQDRRTRGLPTLSIAWGPWDGTGLLASGASGATIVPEFLRQGMRPFSPAQGRTLFTALAGRSDAAIAVLPVDWRAFRRAHAGRDLPLLRGIAGTTDSTDIATRLAAASAADRRRLIEGMVREAVAKILKIAPARLDPRKALGAMGLTSLLAMELRNALEAALGRPLSATLAFNHPTVDALVAHLAGAAPAPETPAVQLAPVLPAALADRLEEVAALTDADVVAALRA